MTHFIAYGYNRAEENASPYDVNAVDYDGRNQPYISGRRNIKVYSGIPHYTSPSGGTNLNAAYGDGVKLTRMEGQGNGGLALELSSETINEILNSKIGNLYLHFFQQKDQYQLHSLRIKIPYGDFTFKLMEPTISLNKIVSYNRWELINDASGNIVSFANDDIEVGSEKYISSLGLNIKVLQAVNPGSDPDNIENNGLISGSIEFENSNDRWLSGVPDRDDESAFFSLWGFNWIRSGTYVNETNAQLSDYSSDDPNGAFEQAVVQTTTAFGGFEWTGGTWAPYRYASYFNDGPGLSNSITNLAKLENLNSVDIVITDDQSKWSRVCVVEAQDDPNLSQGEQVKMGLRKVPSVDKDGNEDDSNTTGMGWFPGYAIDIETGERLNIIFSEDSWQTSENGNDMLWNPTGRLVTDEFPQFDQTAPAGEQFTGGNYLLGGKHFIYVVKGESWVKATDEYINDINECDFSPNYDESTWIYEKLMEESLTSKWAVFKNVTWVGMPVLAPGRSLNLSNKATIKLRVTKPYKQYETVDPEKFLDRDMDLNAGNNYVVAYENSASTWGGKTVTYDGADYEVGESFIATSTTNFTGSAKARVVEANSLNSFNPTYSFSTDEIVAVKGNVNIALDAMETIKVVPNPYYGYSTYETNQLDNRVKITNLPQQATIKIFSVGGALVRTLKKDDNVTSIDWDLKNNFGIPIASGLYIIHVRARIWDATTREYIEKDKVIKWFGSLRPIDLDTF